MSDSRPGMAPEAKTAAGSIRGLAGLPDDARLWIFGASRPLDEQEATSLISSTQRFLEEWAAHGRALAVAFEWLHNRFLLVAVDEDRAAASGCSIDALLQYVKRLEQQLDVRLLDGGGVWLRAAAGIQCVGRREFRGMAERGEVDGNTIVFDLTVQHLGDVRAGRWELLAASSWHARLLPSAGS